MSNCIEIYEAILNEVEKGEVNIVLNFRKLSFIDSSCLGMLLRCLERVRLKGGSLVVVSNPFVERVLTVTGLAHLFNLSQDEGRAVDRLETTTENSA